MSGRALRRAIYKNLITSSVARILSRFFLELNTSFLIYFFHFSEQAKEMEQVIYEQESLISVSGSEQSVSTLKCLFRNYVYT